MINQDLKIILKDYLSNYRLSDSFVDFASDSQSNNLTEFYFKTESKAGIKLLSSSNTVVKNIENDVCKPKYIHKRNRSKCGSDSEEENEDIRKCAVTIHK